MSLPAGYLKFRGQLAEANDQRFYPVQWLDRQIETGLSHPIIGEKSAMVVGVRTYPGGARIGHIRAACGDLEELVNILAPIAEEWGRDNQCDMALLEGREGWKRALNGHGWRTYQIALLKDL